MTMQEGVVIAVVESRNDPKKEGRVTLRYKWLPGQPLSDWAAIAAPLAGSKRGAWLMPEKGDEVLVAFRNGRFDHPYVIGFLWNGKSKPPEQDLQHRVIVTPGGHQLRFEDNDKKKQIVLRTPGKHTLTLSDVENAMKLTVRSGKEHLIEIDDVANTITLQTKNGPKVTLTDSPSSITLEGGGRKIALANGKVAIT